MAVAVRWDRFILLKQVLSARQSFSRTTPQRDEFLKLCLNYSVEEIRPVFLQPGYTL